MKFARIVNTFWNKFDVPLWKAKEMMLNKEISDFEPIDVEDSRNVDAPETQMEFERRMAGQVKSSVEIENENLKIEISMLKQKDKLQPVSQVVVDTSVLTLEELQSEYKAKFEKEVPVNKKNDTEWIRTQLTK